MLAIAQTRHSNIKASVQLRSPLNELRAQPKRPGLATATGVLVRSERAHLITDSDLQAATARPIILERLGEVLSQVRITAEGQSIDNVEMKPLCHARRGTNQTFLERLVNALLDDFPDGDVNKQLAQRGTHISLVLLFFLGVGQGVIGHEIIGGGAGGTLFGRVTEPGPSAKQLMEIEHAGQSDSPPDHRAWSPQ